MTHAMSQMMGQMMRMEQKLTPQLIQSMDILQLSTQALESRIAEELEKNVALEAVNEAPAEPKVGGASDGGDGHRATEDTESFTRLERFTREYDLGFDERVMPRTRRADAGDRDAKMDAMANTASRSKGLDEHLLEQWTLLDMDDATRRAGEAIIYHLEDDGYLKIPLERIAEDARPSLGVVDMERALPLVQRLDPVGIAARDYRECLLLQLERLPGDNAIERHLIERFLKEVSRHRYPAIAKMTGYTVGEITSAIDVIRHSLILQPGYLVVERRVPRVYPDVIVEEDLGGKGLVIKLARGNLPELRINADVLEQLKGKENGKDVRNFLRKQVESAAALIEAVKFRKNRLMEVAEAVVRHQASFFDVGPSGLNVFRMSDLAAELGCDPSTISRTVSDKYMDTPHGVFPMRHFFTGGTDTGDGVGTSWDSIKQRVAELAKNEDPKNPLNDDQIATALAREGIHIKRRTVAKYRAQLDIPSARKRTQF
ncbi:MAG: RNA polymerase factor sigma-54 [Phycisphaerales bacterium]|nr:RNA polymerase factor sigma-54 [Phycisphaerales bacterium]